MSLQWTRRTKINQYHATSIIFTFCLVNAHIFQTLPKKVVVSDLQPEITVMVSSGVILPDSTQHLHSYRRHILLTGNVLCVMSCKQIFVCKICWVALYVEHHVFQPGESDSSKSTAGHSHIVSLPAYKNTHKIPRRVPIIMEILNGTQCCASSIKMHHLIAIKYPQCLGFSPFITNW